MSEDVINAIKDEGWGIIFCEKQGDEYIIEIEKWSDLGEDIVEDVWFDGTDEGLKEGLNELYENFDIDEHVEPLVAIRGTHGVPGSICALVEDAESIDEMLENLADAVSEAVN